MVSSALRSSSSGLGASFAGLPLWSCIIAVCLGLPGGAHAVDTGWSYSFGTSSRQIGVSFDLGAPPRISTAGAYTVQAATGLGDVGVVTGPGQTITYADGTVGPDLANDGRGNTSFSVADVSQVVYATRTPGDDFVVPGSVTFTSSGTTFAYAETFAATPLMASDTETIVNPYAEMRQRIFEVAGFGVDVSFGWAFLRSSHATRGPTGSITVTETATTSQYTYVYDFLSEEDDLPAGFPPTFDNTNHFGVVYDAGAYNNWAGFEPSDPYNAQDPTTTITTGTTAVVVAFLQARSTADLDLGVNVLPAMMDAQWRITPRFAVRVGAGPTLNVISYRFRNDTDWFLNGARFATVKESNSGTHVSVGASFRTTLSIALTPDGRWSFEAGGGYDFVPSHTITVGNARAKIDLSSWVSTTGFRVVF